MERYRVQECSGKTFISQEERERAGEGERGRLEEEGELYINYDTH